MRMAPRTGLSRRRLLAAGVTASAAVHARAALSHGHVAVALVPYLSSRVMMSVYEPLRRHLEAAMGRPVEFYTAPSFAAMIDSVRRRSQPFTMMPMHLARIAVSDWGHTLVARSRRESAVQLLALRRQGIVAPGGLPGRRVATIDPLSITSIMLQRWLALMKLDGVVAVVQVPNANAAVIALAGGDVDLMVVAQGQLVDVPGASTDEVVQVAHLGSTLTPCFVALREVPAEEVASFRRALLSFRPPAGQVGAAAAAYAEGSARDLEPYETYAADARRMLAPVR